MIGTSFSTMFSLWPIIKNDNKVILYFLNSLMIALLTILVSFLIRYIKQFSFIEGNRVYKLLISDKTRIFYMLMLLGVSILSGNLDFINTVSCFLMMYCLVVTVSGAWILFKNQGIKQILICGVKTNIKYLGMLIIKYLISIFIISALLQK